MNDSCSVHGAMIRGFYCPVCGHTEIMTTTLRTDNGTLISRVHKCLHCQCEFVLVSPQISTSSDNMFITLDTGVVSTGEESVSESKQGVKTC